MGFFQDKDIDINLLETILANETQVQNPVLGYYAQYQLKSKLKDLSPETLNDFQDDGDLSIKIDASKYVVECKLISKKIKKGNARYIQMQSSNCRKVRTISGEEHRTCKYVVGTFDIIAACTFPIDGKWNFLFYNAANLKQDGKGFWSTIQMINGNWDENIRKVL